VSHAKRPADSDARGARPDPISHAEHRADRGSDVSAPSVRRRRTK
jgi:hypothetical protein